MTADPACATLIDGKAFAAGLVERVAAASARLESTHGVKPGLAVIIVGDDPASQVYVRNKGETTQRAGMRSDTHRLADTTSQTDLLALVAQLNADPGIHGISARFQHSQCRVCSQRMPGAHHMAASKEQRPGRLGIGKTHPNSLVLRNGMIRYPCGVAG
jgi:hypothetical protein